MGTDADRAAVPERPATPPRPGVPPRPPSPPGTAPADAPETAAAGSGHGSESGSGADEAATSGTASPLSPPLTPSAPAPPAAPPRPAVPPRPSVPPRPATSLFPVEPVGSTAAEQGDAAAAPGAETGAADGTAGRGEETGREPEAEPTPEDESSPQMPHSREREEDVAERSERASVPAPRDSAHTLRPPVPTLPPQPAPPDGEPLTAPRTATSPRTGPATPPPPATEPSLRPSAAEPPSPRPSAAPPSEAEPPPPPGVPARFGLAPVADSRGHAPLTVRTVVVAVCLVLGVGLLGGVGAGVLLSGDAGERPTVAAGFDGARAAWHEIPVDELFPRGLQSKGAGPGGADRRWTRVAVAPDSGCKHAFDPLLTKALAPVGCARLVRATYADETSSSVTTVGLMFTKADPAAMRDLRERFAAQNLPQRTDLMPRPYAARGTVAANFGDAQRASWTVRVLRDAPVVVYSVSGFADGRVVTDPQSANDATRKGETSAAAQAGLGHDAQGIADRIERRLREATTERESGSSGEAKGRDKKNQDKNDQGRTGRGKESTGPDDGDDQQDSEDRDDSKDAEAEGEAR
ncbi:hypothetical protein ACQEU8_24020 [Streptomyces sp. CA-250714]|uniref:hypothetical protein n=1 Tax=Streptomyces sp. CA-250714 TaxID=3240060 RepID=UPI003D8A1F2C